MAQPSAQGFGVGQEGGGEHPPLKLPALWDLRKERIPAGKNPMRVQTTDRRCSRVSINVFAGAAYCYFSSGGGHGELPDLILTEGMHVLEFAPRNFQMSIFNGQGDSTNDDLFVSVLLTNPVEDHAHPPCGGDCGGHK